MASTSLPLATAAAVATFFAAPAGAVPNDQPTTPATPAPVQPGTNVTPEQQPQTQGPTQPGTGPQSQQPQTPESKPTPSQPGVTTPEQDQALPDKTDPKLNRPTQPGVTTPRVAPLPVPGQEGQPAPGQAAPGAPAPGQDAVAPDQVPGTPQAPGAQDQPAATPSGPGGESQAAPGTAPQSQAPQADTDSAPTQTLVEPRWEAPRNESAPPAPVVEMTGPHAEVGAAVDGGALLPGYVANTHHFSNEAGYVGTVGYTTPTGSGEAGVSVEFVDTNTIHVSSFTGGEGLADAKSSVVLDTTQVNLAKAAVEDWIKAQPGGAAALDAAAQVKLPPIVPPGDSAPTTVNVGGVTTQWGGSLQY
ncbi:hypothetical protein [Nocardia sp. NPDC057353]|uniref:hypothetical protein n=1 Tax=Nocardia sp. NPDC057353 TaxID=3346104 RepID=UPI0036329FCF